MADGDAQRYAQIASLVAFTVAVLCLFAWLLRLSALVKRDPRQELLGIGAANLAAAMGHGYPVAGGLSQSAVNDKAGARSSLALVFASITLALCLLFLTGLLENLPKAVLAAVVLTAVYGLLDFPALLRMWRVSRLDFYAAAIALGAVLLLGILQGILLAALASILLLLARVSRPHVHPSPYVDRTPATRRSAAAGAYGAGCVQAVDAYGRIVTQCQ
jgi:MFS superfamily sulfate permease-like transporter